MKKYLVFYVQGKQYKVEIDDDLDRELRFYLKDKYVFDENNCLILEDIGKYNFNSKLIYDRVLAEVLQNQSRESHLKAKVVNEGVSENLDLTNSDLDLGEQDNSVNNDDNIVLNKEEKAFYEETRNEVNDLYQNNALKEEESLKEISQDYNSEEIIKDTIEEVLEQEQGGVVEAEKINEAIDRIEIASSMEEFREKVQVDVVTFDESEYIKKVSQSTDKIILPPSVSKEEAISQVIDALCKDKVIKEKIVKKVNFKKEVMNSFNNLTSNLKLQSVNERNLNYYGDLFVREYQKICRESGVSPEDMFRDYFSNSGARRYSSPLNRFISSFIKFSGGGNQALRGLFEAMLVKKAIAAGMISSKYNSYLKADYRYLNTSGNGNVYFEDTVLKALKKDDSKIDFNNEGDKAIWGAEASSNITQDMTQESRNIASSLASKESVSGKIANDLHSKINNNINSEEKTSINTHTDLQGTNEAQLNANNELQASAKGPKAGLNNLGSLQNSDLAMDENSQLGNFNNNIPNELGVINGEVNKNDVFQMASVMANKQNSTLASEGGILSAGKTQNGSSESTTVSNELKIPQNIQDGYERSLQDVTAPNNASSGLETNAANPNVNALIHKMNGKNKWTGVNKEGYGALHSNGAYFGKKNNQVNLRSNFPFIEENEVTEDVLGNQEEDLEDSNQELSENNLPSTSGVGAVDQDNLEQNLLDDASEDLKETVKDAAKKEAQKKAKSLIGEFVKKHPGVVVGIIVALVILLIIFLAVLVASNENNRKKGMAGSGCIGEGGNLMSFLEGWEGTSGEACTINGLSGNRAVDQGDGTLTVGAGVTNHLLSSVTEYIEANNLKGYFHYSNGKYRMNVGDCIPEDVWNELKEVGVELIYAAPIDDIAAELGLELTQYQKDAITSFNYNVGPGHTREMLEAYSNEGYEGLWNFMKVYVRSQGSQLAGLQKRRKGEFALFVTGDYSDQDLFYGRGLDDYDNYDSESVKAREYVCQYGGSGEGLIADLNGFMQRLTRPLRSNPYYYDQNNRQLAYTALEGECAWYAGHRAKEILATIGSTKSWNSMPNGGSYCSASEVTSGEFSSSTNVQNPRAGSLISWGKSGGYGHVAVVEQVYGDGSILISEAYIGLGIYGKNARTTIHKYSDAKTIRMKNCEGNGSGCFTTRKIPANQIKNAGWSSGYYFKCYIYLG